MAPILPVPLDVPNDCTEAGEASENEEAIYALSDSESNSDGDEHNGYEPLSQDPDNCFSINDEFIENSTCVSDDEDSGVPELNNSLILPAPPDASLPSQPDCKPANEFKMDDDQIETIKSLMKGITLPTTNVPQWAFSVPEAEWKTTLFNNVLSKKKTTEDQNSSSCTDVTEEANR